MNAAGIDKKPPSSRGTRKQHINDKLYTQGRKKVKIRRRLKERRGERGERKRYTGLKGRERRKERKKN